jgi:hypothetical protein
MEKDLDVSRNFRVSSRGGGLTDDWRGLEPYMEVWESELRFMAGHAAKWNAIETGGEVYGLLSHAGRPVIMLATPPGRNATHEVAWFRQDMDFFKKVNAFLGTHFGIQYLGPFHSHHHLGLEGLSGVDIQSTHNIALKNGFNHLTQFVVTFEKKSFCDLALHNQAYSKETGHVANELKQERRWFTDSYTRVRERIIPSPVVSLIRIHCFFFPDAARGKPVRCPIRIIPGTSPFRRAIMRNSKIKELGNPYTYPMDRILLDSLDTSQALGDHDRELPERLSGQWLELPGEVREKTRVTFKEGLIVLSLPLPPAEGTILVAYNDKPPYRVEAVYLSQNGKTATPIDVGKEALCFGPYTRLAWIHERVVRLIAGESPARRLAEKGETDEKAKSKEGRSKEEVLNGVEESRGIEKREVL